MNTRNLAVILGFAVLAITVGVLVTHQADAQETKKKPIEFAMKNIEGKTVKLSSYRGNVVVVDVWATWCGYCVQEIPGLIAMQDDAMKQKKLLRIIGVSVDTSRKDVAPFAREHKINYPVLYAEKKAMKPFGAITGLPTKFIIDKKGVIVDTIVGAVDMDDLAQRIAPYLK